MSDEPKRKNCLACGKQLPQREPDPIPSVVFCEDCHRRYPPALLKACYDVFEYAARLTTGELVLFSKATIHGDYATLAIFHDLYEEQGLGQLPCQCPRGLEVRVDQIVWCADAPFDA